MNYSENFVFFYWVCYCDDWLEFDPLYFYFYITDYVSSVTNCFCNNHSDRWPCYWEQVDLKKYIYILEKWNKKGLSWRWGGGTISIQSCHSCFSCEQHTSSGLPWSSHCDTRTQSHWGWRPTGLLWPPPWGWSQSCWSHTSLGKYQGSQNPEWPPHSHPGTLWDKRVSWVQHKKKSKNWHHIISLTDKWEINMTVIVS